MVKDNVNSGNHTPDVTPGHPRSTDNDIFSRNLNKNKQRKRGRIWKGLGLFTLVVAGAGYAFSRTVEGTIISNAVISGIQAKRNPDLIFDRAGRDQVNILLIGRDVNWKISKVYDPNTKTYRPYQVPDETTPARSDTMIIVSLDKARNSIRMVSLPRDATVHMPPNPEGVRRAKLNAAHAYGGPDLLVQTVQEELGITIDHYAVIKFEGFKKLIDEVGGIEVDVDGALKRDSNGKLYRGNLDYDDNWGNLHIHMKPGRQRLTGDQAHSYVRFRMDLEGDPGRIRRQQQVMRALAKEIMHANPFKIPGLVREVHRQFKTDLADDEIASAAYFARNLGDAAKIQPMTLFGSFRSRGSFRLNRPKNEKLLAYIFGPTFNPASFLPNSPSTTGDEIGPTNNANPAALAILRAAGIIDADDMPGSTEQHVPIRVEAGDDDEGSSRSDDSTPRSRRSRVAVHDAESSSSQDGEGRTNRSRRERSSSDRSSSRRSSSDRSSSQYLPSRRHSDSTREDTVERSDSTSQSDTESSDRQSSSESPIPVPEGEASTARSDEGLKVED